MENKEIKAISVSQLKENDVPMSILNDDIVLAGNVEYKLDMFNNPCRLSAFVVMLCIKGEADIQINLHNYTVRAGTLSLNVPENIIHITRAENFVVYPIFISEAFLRQMKLELKKVLSLYMYIKSHPLIQLSIEEIRSLEKFYFLVQDTMQSADAYKAEIMKGLLHALLFKLDEITSCHRKQEEHTSSIGKSRSEIVFDSFMQLLSLHHTEERSVKFYAVRMNITSNYLSGLIKEYSGKTAAEWIDEYVILEAKTLLRHSGLSIQEVAYRLNFSTQTFFGKYFKRVTGMSPKKYIEK